MTQWTLVDLAPETQARLGAPMPPWPVRKGTKPGMPVEDLLGELRAWLDEFPDHRETYRLAAAVLAYVAGVRAGRGGDHEGARALFLAGLELDPGNLRLLGELFWAELSLGHERAALAIADAYLAQPDVAPQAIMYPIAAKLCLRHGRDAMPFLEPLIALAPADPLFWELVACAKES